VLTEVKTSEKLQLGFYRKSILGRGGHGRVYTGMFTGQLVAVKRIACTDPDEGHNIFQRGGANEGIKTCKHRSLLGLLKRFRFSMSFQT